MGGPRSATGQGAAKRRRPDRALRHRVQAGQRGRLRRPAEPLAGAARRLPQGSERLVELSRTRPTALARCFARSSPASTRASPARPDQGAPRGHAARGWPAALAHAPRRHPRPPRTASNARTPGYIHHVGWPGAREYPGHTPNELDRPAKTVKAGVHGVPGGESVLRSDDGSIRYLTVREVARIMTFPDDWRLEGPRESRCANSATPSGRARRGSWSAIAKALAIDDYRPRSRPAAARPGRHQSHHARSAVEGHQARACACVAPCTRGVVASACTPRMCPAARTWWCEAGRSPSSSTATSGTATPPSGNGGDGPVSPTCSRPAPSGG